VQDRLGEHEGLDVLQPQQGQLEHARSPAAAAAAAAAGAQGTASCPVPSEPITSDSSVTGSAPHSYDDEGEAADTAEGASPAAVTAGVTAAAASAVPPNLRLGDPEVVSGKRAACCTIIRLSLTGKPLLNKLAPCNASAQCVRSVDVSYAILSIKKHEDQQSS
jgi:hypothetical protein